MKELERCEEIRAYLSLDIQDSSPSAALREHLKVCVACQAFEQALARLPALLGPMREMQPSAALWKSIEQRAANKQQAVNAWRPSFSSWALPAAAGLIAFLAVSNLLDGPQPGMPVFTEGQAMERIFSRLERSLRSPTSIQRTPEGELLAHLIESTERK